MIHLGDWNVFCFIVFFHFQVGMGTFLAPIIVPTLSFAALAWIKDNEDDNVRQDQVKGKVSCRSS